MKKLLFLLLLLPCLSYGAAGTLYGVDVTNADSVDNGTQGRMGFFRIPRLMSVQDNGNWVFLVPFGTSNTRLLTTTNQGTSWTTTTASGGYPIGGEVGITGLRSMNMVTVGDSSFYVGITAAGANLFVRKIKGVALDSCDTVLTTPGSTQLRTLVNYFHSGTKDSFVVLGAKEQTSYDSLYLWKSEGPLTATTTWSQVFPTGSANMKQYNIGSSVVCGRYVIWYDEGGLDTLWCATPSGIDTLTQNLLSITAWLPMQPGSTSSTTQAQYQYALGSSGDTMVWFAWAASEALYTKRYKISGEPPSVSFTFIDSVLVAPADSFPTPAASGYAGYLCLWPEPQFVNVGDTAMYLFYKNWPNQSNLDSINICYRKWTGSGWGNQTIAESATVATETRFPYRLQAPRKVPGGATVHIPLAWTDSSSTGGTLDSLYIFDFALTSGGGSPATTTNAILRGGVVRSGIVRNRPEVIWREE